MTASLEKFRSEFIDRETFEREVLRAYADGSAEACLPADRAVALSWMPPATGALRDFSTIAPDLPLLEAEKCVGCMECVTQCPDTAILAKVVPARDHAALAEKLKAAGHGDFIAGQFARTTKSSTYRRAGQGRRDVLPRHRPRQVQRLRRMRRRLRRSSGAADDPQDR
jgi:ferredoxin